MKTYMFMYLLSDDIGKVRESLGDHVKYWKSQNFEYYKNGPFADKSGGLIIFSAKNDAAAVHIIEQDPLFSAHVIKQHWLKEWVF